MLFQPNIDEVNLNKLDGNLLCTKFAVFFNLGYINLNDACLSNTDLATSSKMPRPSSDRKLSLKEPSNSVHGFHYRSHQHRDFDIPEINDRVSHADREKKDSAESGSSGRQSRFEYCNSYYSNLSQYGAPHRNSEAAAAFAAPSYEPDSASNFDFQSEENLFNMNFDSFYEDFVDSAELSWSSTSSASSTSFESSSVSSINYDKKYVILPEIKLVNEALEKSRDEKALLLAETEEKPKETTGKMRCFHCNKKLGIIMIMKVICNQ